MLLMCAPSLGFLLVHPAPAAVRCRASAPTMGILDFMKAPEQRDEPKTDWEPPFPGSKALVSEVMAPLDKLVTLRPDQTLQEAGRTTPEFCALPRNSFFFLPTMLCVGCWNVC